MEQKWAIVENPDSRYGLPDHWSDINIDGVDYRVMERFSDKEEAEDEVSDSYGMYAKDASVVNLEDEMD